jgi:hypothetical protein
VVRSIRQTGPEFLRWRELRGHMLQVTVWPASILPTFTLISRQAMWRVEASAMAGVPRPWCWFAGSRRRHRTSIYGCREPRGGLRNHSSVIGTATSSFDI